MRNVLARNSSIDFVNDYRRRHYRFHSFGRRRCKQGHAQLVMSAGHVSVVYCMSEWLTTRWINRPLLLTAELLWHCHIFLVYLSWASQEDEQNYITWLCRYACRSHFRIERRTGKPSRIDQIKFPLWNITIGFYSRWVNDRLRRTG